MKNRTILLIEDNLDILENTTEILEMEGYRVLAAPNGEKGMELAVQHQPDLIISDILVPRINGYELLKILKKEPATANIPFMFLSASAQREEPDLFFPLANGEIPPSRTPKEFPTFAQNKPACATSIRKTISPSKRSSASTRTC